MVNLQILIAIHGECGGTIHQVKDYYQTTISEILELDNNWLMSIYKSMQDGSIITPKILNLAKKYYCIDNVSLLQVTELVIKLKLHHKI